MPMTNPDAAPQRVSRRHRRAPMAAINVTPFVDVMLVLLIVFMVTAPLLTVGRHGRPAAHPQLAACPGQDEPLSVSVDREGQVFLQDSQLAVDELGPRLIAITERNPEARIFVRGDRVIDYGRVMEVVGAIHAAGFSKVALVTELDRDAP